MKISVQKEAPLIVLVLLPLMYLAYIWNDLPKKVPMHWNLQGEIDRYGSKLELILIPTLLPLFIYVILISIPYIDPKKKIKNMGNKYVSLKKILTLVISVLALFILYFSKNQPNSSPNYIILFVGILYIILGNYFKTIKPNYFVGIRTPWTLENEIVWKETHNMAGKMWFIGGLIIVLTCLILGQQSTIVLSLVITCVITIVPIFYSYFKFKNN